MALSKEAKIASIVVSAASLAKKDRSVLGSRLEGWSEADLNSFRTSLEKLEGAQDVSRGAGVKKLAMKENEQDRILTRIWTKLEENESQGVRLNIDAMSDGLSLVGEAMRDVERKKLIERFQILTAAVDNLSIAKAMLQFEQGRLSYFLGKKHSMSIEEQAREFQITVRKVKEYINYYLFCLEYPGVIFSTYSMTTILSHQKAIERKAKVEPRFLEVLKMQIEGVELSTLAADQPKEKILLRWYEDGKYCVIFSSVLFG